MERQIKSMHLQHRLIQRLNNEKIELSYTLLAGYLLNHYDKLSELSIENVCDDNYISKSTLRRFCQSLGYENFTDLKESKQEGDRCNSDYNIDLVKEIKAQLTEFNFDRREFREIAKYIKSHDLIFVLFPSNLYSSAYSFQQQLIMNRKYLCLVPNIDNIFPFITKGLEGSLVIILDYNLEYTKEALSYLKNIKCKKIAIGNGDGASAEWTKYVKLSCIDNVIIDKYLYSVYFDEVFLSYIQLENEL